MLEIIGAIISRSLSSEQTNPWQTGLGSHYFHDTEKSQKTMRRAVEHVPRTSHSQKLPRQTILNIPPSSPS